MITTTIIAPQSNHLLFIESLPDGPDDVDGAGGGVGESVGGAAGVSGGVCVGSGPCCGSIKSSLNLYPYSSTAALKQNELS